MSKRRRFAQLAVQRTSVSEFLHNISDAPPSESPPRPESPMRYAKIKTDGKRVALEWFAPAPRGDANKAREVDVLHTVDTDKAPPLPAFPEALARLKPLLLRACELPEEYGASITVTTLSFSEDRTGRPGVILTGVKRTEAHDGIVVLNAPLARFLQDGETPDDVAPSWLMLTPDEAALITAVQAAATDYLNGRREQADLFDQAEPTASSAEK